MIDIDGTICTQTTSSYTEAEPYPDRIAKINELHDKGDEIIYWTARGMASGTDWSETIRVTRSSTGRLAAWHQAQTGRS